MSKLVIVNTHPIQYNAPMFRYAAKYMDLHVLYCMNPDKSQVGKSGFGIDFKWDVDLLSGYDHSFLDNVSSTPDVSSYNGCDTPDIGIEFQNLNATHIIVFGWNVKSYLQAVRAAKKLGLTVAVRGDSQLSPNVPIWKKLIKRIAYPRFLSRFDYFLYVGKRNKAYLEHFGVPENKLIFSPHAVDQDFWRDYNESNVQVKNATYTFLWIGKFIDKKRPEDAIRAILMLRKKYDVELVMIGEGALKEALQIKYESSPIVRFEGFKNQTELKDYYHQSDCLVLTSDFGETWGLVVNEAFAAGTPAIVSNGAGCNPDLIQNEKTGYSYQLGDVKELFEAMCNFIGLDNVDDMKLNIEKLNSIYSYQSNVLAFEQFVTQGS